MKKVWLLLSAMLIVLGCKSKPDVMQSSDLAVKPVIQAVLNSPQFDSLVNGLFEFRGKQLTLIRNDLIKSDIPLNVNGIPVLFTNINVKNSGQNDPFKPVFHAELRGLSFQPNKSGSLTMAIYSVGLIFDAEVTSSESGSWKVTHFKWYRT